MFAKDQLVEFLRQKGYRTHPQGIIQHYPVDGTFESQEVAFLDLPADAIRKGNEVPDRPIRVTAHLEEYGGGFSRWKLASAKELPAGVGSKAPDRDVETPKVSPSWPGAQ
jgi:hypothetical protein